MATVHPPAGTVPAKLEIGDTVMINGPMAESSNGAVSVYAPHPEGTRDMKFWRSSPNTFSFIVEHVSGNVSYYVRFAAGSPYFPEAHLGNADVQYPGNT